MVFGENNPDEVRGHFCIVTLDGKYREILRQLPGGDKADSVLGYVYYDGEAGLTLEILAAVLITDCDFCILDGDDSITLKIRLGALKGLKYTTLDDTNGSLYKKFEQKMEMLSEYDSSTGLSEFHEDKNNIYHWEKFYPFHATDSTVEEMISDGIRLVPDKTITDTDIVYALGELEKERHKMKVIQDLLISGYEVTESLIMEEFDTNGDGPILRMLISLYKGKFSEKTVNDFLEFGCEKDVMMTILSRQDGGLTFAQIVEVIDYPDEFPDAFIRDILLSAKGQPTYEELDELFDSINPCFYTILKPYVAKLPFEQRVELKDMYDL